MTITTDPKGINRIIETIQEFINNNSDGITSVINGVGDKQYLFTVRKGDNAECVLEFVDVDELEKEYDKDKDEFKEPKRYEE